MKHGECVTRRDVCSFRFSLPALLRRSNSLEEKRRSGARFRTDIVIYGGTVRAGCPSINSRGAQQLRRRQTAGNFNLVIILHLYLAAVLHSKNVSMIPRWKCRLRTKDSVLLRQTSTDIALNGTFIRITNGSVIMLSYHYLYKFL